MKPKYAVLKQVGDKLFVDVWMEEKPREVTYIPNGKKIYTTFGLNNAIKEWQKSAQTIEVHPTMVEKFKELGKEEWFEIHGENCPTWLEFLARGIEIPCENIEIRTGDYPDDLQNFAFLHQEKEEKPSESTKQTQDELWNMFYNELDSLARDVDHYDFGLPMTDEDADKIIETLKSKYTITKNLTNH